MAASGTAARIQNFIELSFLFKYISFSDLSLIGLRLRQLQTMRTEVLKTPVEMILHLLYSYAGDFTVAL
jgi:hypothetical protein